MSPSPKDALITALEHCERLAAGRWWKRLFHAPLSFIKAIGSRSFLQPFFKDGIDTKAVSFFGREMDIRLPAATDIYLTGCKSHPSEIRLAKWMINNIQPGWDTMDVGAHFGYYTLLLHELTGPHGKTIAFEPSRLAFEKLTLNVAKQDRILAINLGAGSITGKQLLAERGTRSSESNSFFDLAGARTILAAIVKLDDWIQEHAIIPKFIKVDVEGGEWELVKGASALLFLYHPIIAMEIRTVHFEESYYPAIEWLKANGYRMYSLAADGGLMHCGDAWSYLQSGNTHSDNFLFIAKRRGGN
ncbi:MAG: FkbM family methyltransferase [Bacteroidota bacterium]